MTNVERIAAAGGCAIRRHAPPDQVARTATGSEKSQMTYGVSAVASRGTDPNMLVPLFCDLPGHPKLSRVHVRHIQHGRRDLTDRVPILPELDRVFVVAIEADVHLPRV